MRETQDVMEEEMGKRLEREGLIKRQVERGGETERKTGETGGEREGDERETEEDGTTEEERWDGERWL